MNDENKTSNISVGGDVSGGNVNIGGTQSFGDGATFTFSAGGANAESAALTELKQLYTELAAALQQIPAAQQEQLDAVQQLAQSALDEAQKEKPNKTLLTVTGEGLKQAAENLAGVAPIAMKIAKALLLLG